MTDRIKDGGQAFPRAGAQTNAGWSRPTNGMTIRDWFAGQALAGMLAFDGYAAPVTDKTTAEVFADSSYEIADAMLSAREGKQ